MFVLQYLFCVLLLCALVKADCIHYSDNTEYCCISVFNDYQACIMITVENNMIKFQQYYNENVMNEMTFQSNNPPLEGSNCAADGSVGWCVLLTDYKSNSTVASGTLTSTFSNNQGNNVIIDTQGSFHINHDSSKRVVLKPNTKYADTCSELCLEGGGCKCLRDTGCNCCSNETSKFPTCVQVGGVAEIRFLRSSLYIGGKLRLTTVSKGDAPQPLCSVDESGKEVVCLYFSNLDYSVGVRGSTSSVINTENIKEYIFSGDFVLM